MKYEHHLKLLQRNTWDVSAGPDGGSCLVSKFQIPSHYRAYVVLPVAATCRAILVARACIRAGFLHFPKVDTVVHVPIMSSDQKACISIKIDR